jgi:hypothetical protein
MSRRKLSVSVKTRQYNLAPLPQLFPHLHQRLHLLWTRQPIVDQPAITIRAIVEIPHRRHAQMRQIVTHFLQLVLA